MLTKAPFHIIYHQFTVNSFNTENPPADTNKVRERERERETGPCQAPPPLRPWLRDDQNINK